MGIEQLTDRMRRKYINRTGDGQWLHRDRRRKNGRYGEGRRTGKRIWVYDARTG
jgi:hypothetical protein